MKYWLLKSEPGTFGIDDLAKAPRQTTAWEGVRNFQARNFLRDDIRKGDRAFFYHSSCAVPGIAGTVTVLRAGHADPTAFDDTDDHFDPKSDAASPTWYAVDVKLDEKFDPVVSLETLRMHSTRELKDLVILRRGNRLSVTPVTKSQWDFIVSLHAAPSRVRSRRKSLKK